MPTSMPVPDRERFVTEINADETALRLEEENRKLKEARTYRICMNHGMITLLLPCGHLSCCEMCSKSLSRCPVCRNIIRGVGRLLVNQQVEHVGRISGSHASCENVCHFLDNIFQ